MDQVKIGSFLKELRKEKGLTQENLAEQLNVSNRTISRWETGSNMPDIGMLVEIADFYDVSIPEIIDGERKSENMNQETRDTAIKMAEYSKNEVKAGKQKVIGYLMSVFGIFVIVSALAVFPNDSSWGSIYSIIGSIILVIGIYLIIKPVVIKRSLRILSVIASVVLLFGIFTVSDYIAVSQFHQVPRFRYETYYDSRQPDQLIHKTLFFTVVQKNPGTEYETIEIVKDNAQPKAADDEIKLLIQLDLKEDIGLLLIDYDADGSEGIGGISNADKTMIKHDELCDYTFFKQELDDPSGIEELTIKFTVLTEYVEPNYENNYPEELKIPMDAISLKANFGRVYFITISGDKINGYHAVLAEP